jgi:hypothetical protein
VHRIYPGEPVDKEVGVGGSAAKPICVVVTDEKSAQYNEDLDAEVAAGDPPIELLSRGEEIFKRFAEMLDRNPGGCNGTDAGQGMDGRRGAPRSSPAAASLTGTLH